MRRTAVVGVSVAVVLAFILVVPVASMTFPIPPVNTPTCTIAGQIMTGCPSLLVREGYGSITFWLFGTGGFYNTISSQYSFS